LAAEARKARESPAEQPKETFFNPWADMQPVRFPLDALPDVLRAYAEDRSKTIGADVGAVAWACLNACGAAMDASIRLQMKEHDSWTVPPFFWLALIGDPSTRKTPILECAFAPLRQAQQIDIDARQAEHRKWVALPKKDRSNKPEPVCRRRLLTDDSTPEAVEEILRRQDRGIAVIRDELAGWIGSMEKYGGGKSAMADRGFWLQSHNGGNYVTDRIIRGTGAITNHAAGVVGGIQPDRLRRIGDITSDGLLQRFVSVILAPAFLGGDNPDPQISRNYEDLINKLLALPGNRRAALAPGARKIRQEAERGIFQREQNMTLGPSFSALCGKMHGLWGRLALILSQIETDGKFDMVVNHRIAAMADRLIFESVLPNAARVYAGLGGAGADIQLTRAVAGYILVKKLQRLLASDLTRNVHACRGMALEEVQKVLSPLVAGGWLAPEKEYNPTAWAVMPGVHEHFASRAAVEATRREEIRSLIAGTVQEAST
jgi:hypothetical protein